jgi:glycosyltransferase involved in cell wall biosynthesis
MKPCMLHVFATFDAGGPQVRTIEVLKAAGQPWRHVFVAADGRSGARSLLHALHDAEVVDAPRAHSTTVAVRRLLRLIRDHKPALVLTYNWGGMDGAFAALFSRTPFVHHEEVTPFEELHTPLLRRNLVRRFVLPRAHAVVVPSTTMHERAARAWKTQPARVHFIPNGVDTAARRPTQAARTDGSVVVGCVAHLRPEKNIPRLLHAFALVGDERTSLLIVGDGNQRERCVRTCEELGIRGRVTFVGHDDDTARHYAAMDVFALPSDDEQMPMVVLEAMAHGLPVVATDVGDIARMLPPRQRAFLAPPRPGSEILMARHLDALIASDELRRSIGAANRAHCEQRHDIASCASSHRSVWLEAMSETSVARRSGAG